MFQEIDAFVWLLSASYYCKSLLPTIGGLDPRVPPGSVLLFSTVKLAPLEDGFCADHAPIGSGKYRTMAKGPTLARYQKLFSVNYQRRMREPCGPYCVHYQDWKILLE